MILLCLCNYFDNNLKSATLVVKSILMNACRYGMFKNLEFLSVAVLIQRETSSMNAFIVASNMFVSISHSNLFTFFNEPFYPGHPQNEITFNFARNEK